MKTGGLVATMTATGILGGIVGALLVGNSSPAAPAPSAPAPGASSSADSDRSESLAKEVADLRARLEEMQGAVAGASRDSTRLQADLEKEKKAAALARNRLESLEKGGAPHGTFEAGAPVTLEGAVPLRLGSLAADRSAMPAALKKTLELMRKPEDERWTAIREALSLSSGQEEELKAAIKERDLAMRDLTKIESHEVTGPDGTTSLAMSVAAPDPEKTKDVRRRYDDRVNANLTADQSKKWRDEGYEAAAGGGGAMVFTSISTDFGETK